MPPSAPNAEPPPSERGSSSISPAAATRLRARRPQRARDPGHPSAARGSDPGGAGPGLCSIPSDRPSRAGRAAASPLLARAVQRPRLPARRPRHSRPCTPAGSEVRALRRLLPAPRRVRLQHRAPLPQPAAAAAHPHLTHFPAGAGGVEKVYGDRSPPPPPARHSRLRRQQRTLRPWSRPRGERSQRPACAASPPGTRSEPAPGARARGLRAGDGHAPPA